MSSQHQSVPDEAPPAYSATDHLDVPGGVAGSSAGREALHRRTSSAGSTSDYTTDEDAADEQTIPEEVRRDLLDESRPLPEGWRREYDNNSQHYFYVDTKADPPRSIWSHPLDPEFIKAHPDVAEKLNPPAKDFGDENLAGTPEASTSEAGSHNAEEKRSFGRKLKDKMTGTTHEQRVEARRRQHEQDKKELEDYLNRRAQIRQAHAEGRYVPMYGAPMGPYSRGPLGYGGYGGRYGYDRYGPRPPGSGIGMSTRPGMGMGMALGGGMLGGLMLGDMMF